MVATGLLLSIFSYQYSSFTSNKIIDVASQEIRSNAKIEVHDISQILANRLQSIGALLQTLADSTSIHNNEYSRADIIINARQRVTSDLTDFYMWLNKNGRINWISNINQSTYQKYKGTDLSYRAYFSEPRDTHTEYYSSLIESNDKVPRLYISYPVFNTTSSSSTNTTITGRTGGQEVFTLERYSHTAYAFPCVGNSAKEYCLGYHDGAIQAHRDFNTGQDVDVDQHPCRHNITEYYHGYSRGYNDEADFLG